MINFDGALKVLMLALLTAAACGASSAENQAPEVKPLLQITPAEHLAAAKSAPILAAASAGTRIVAVGDHGVVLLSDDAGKSYRQARSVPVSSTLTSVFFAGSQMGWAVGHWGVILRTSDGGETWTLQRSDTDVDQPLFSVYFRDANEGWAVGLWSLMLHTVDGGATWTAVKIPPAHGAKKADRNFYSLFADARGRMFIACEQGMVIRSSDGGHTWDDIATGYTGSFWTGTALSDGTLLVGGLRGTVYRSQDGGDSWHAVPTPFKSSITQLMQGTDGNIVAVAMDGVVLKSLDGGATFTGVQRPDRTALTAVVAAGTGAPAVFSVLGPVKP